MHFESRYQALVPIGVEWGLGGQDNQMVLWPLSDLQEKTQKTQKRGQATVQPNAGRLEFCGERNFSGIDVLTYVNHSLPTNHPTKNPQVSKIAQFLQSGNFHRRGIGYCRQPAKIWGYYPKCRIELEGPLMCPEPVGRSRTSD